MNKLKQLLRQPEFQLFIFCFLFVLTNWPFLSIAANSGVKGMFSYLFLLWAMIIILMILIHGSLSGSASDETSDEKRSNRDV